MKMNTRMAQLLAQLKASPLALTGRPSAVKREFVVVDDSVFLKDEFGRAQDVTLGDFPDRTGFECFVNHVHFPFEGTKESLQSCLQYATDLRSQLTEFERGRKFIVIV